MYLVYHVTPVTPVYLVTPVTAVYPVTLEYQVYPKLFLQVNLNQHLYILDHRLNFFQLLL